MNTQNEISKDKIELLKILSHTSQLVRNYEKCIYVELTDKKDNERKINIEQLKNTLNKLATSCSEIENFIKKYKSYYGGEGEEISKLNLYKQAQKEISPIFEKYIRSTKITEIETLIKKIITLRHTKENILIYFYI